MMATLRSDPLAVHTVAGEMTHQPESRRQIGEPACGRP